MYIKREDKMELYIRIKDGQIFEHPILGDNFREAFPDVDVNNLPPEFARFIRVHRPIPSVYQVMNDNPVYTWVNGVVTDDWGLRDMTPEEKAARIAIAMQHQEFPSWTFDEPTCSWIPPIPRPETGLYEWNEETQQWVEIVIPE